ncbi:hypothetical protein IV203_007536 [Nitzschia inconspicua]|uniref:Uncharacterized protein n=1 Tax=Nitzschia inconspicua TaxID=303405 RepID=A0A9K3KF29_9STRA|nr:hypothetical protein IV203_007536 [Nitzschia inconspicua]
MTCEIKVVPKSPVNVIDFSSILELDDCKGTGGLYAPVLQPLHLRFAPTNVCDVQATCKDSLTSAYITTMEEENDASSTVSSISSQTCDDKRPNNELGREGTSDCKIYRNECKQRSREESRRSIFSQYWNTTGQAPIRLMREHSKMTRSTSNPRLSSLDQEDTPNVNPCSSSESPVSSRRRSIFGVKGRFEAYSSIRSLPELSIVPSPSQIESARKTRSISCLRSSEPLVSCLRKSSFHSSLPPKEKILSSSVSFHANVQVITYETPLEHWSDGSWAKLFGIDY